MTVRLRDNLLEGFIGQEERDTMLERAMKVRDTLLKGEGAGSEFLGWVDYPVKIKQSLLDEIALEAERLREISDVVLVAGIGGSYLGSRAAIEFCISPLFNDLREDGTPKIYFVGNDLSASHLNEVLRLCDGERVSAIIISKSGTTIETALGFRVIRAFLEKQIGEQSAERITVITDGHKGGLFNLSLEEGYRCFEIPSDMGGRFSVLSPVGLLPLGVAGVDILALIKGAQKARADLCGSSSEEVQADYCMRYVVNRNILREKGFDLELFAGYEPFVSALTHWLTQLFGESEGKDGKGLFPVGINYTTDLHALGQYVQQGKRLMLETAILVSAERDPLWVPKGIGDGLDFLDGRSLSEMNHLAAKGVSVAHVQGGVPYMELVIPDRTAYSLGYFFYFSMFACGVSGYLLGVNPFDQPGVEDYKRNMLALLGREDLAELKDELCKKLSIGNG